MLTTRPGSHSFPATLVIMYLSSSKAYPWKDTDTAVQSNSCCQCALIANMNWSCKGSHAEVEYLNVAAACPIFLIHAVRRLCIICCCRSSYATPRILTPSCTPTVAEARISDTVIWKDSMDSTADSHTMARLPSLPSSHASVDMTQSYRRFLMISICVAL